MAKHVWPANRVNAAIRAVYVAYNGRSLAARSQPVVSSKDGIPHIHDSIGSLLKIDVLGGRRFRNYAGSRLKCVVLKRPRLESRH